MLYGSVEKGTSSPNGLHITQTTNALATVSNLLQLRMAWPSAHGTSLMQVPFESSSILWEPKPLKNILGYF